VKRPVATTRWNPALSNEYREPDDAVLIPRARSASVALRYSCLAVWLALALLAALLFAQWRRSVLHPAFVPVVLLATTAVTAAAVALALFGWQLIRSTNRGATLLWGGAAILPLILFAMPFESARRQWAQRQLPHGPIGNMVVVTAGALMEGQATHSYPHRLETERLVMFYHELDRPQLDADAMDRQVAQLETKVGQPLRSKIHWVRGSLIGQSKCSFLGLALGSTSSPTDWSGNEGYLDRHELAHAVINQQRPVNADPPMLLHEGWAESQSGLSSAELAARALQTRALHVRQSSPVVSVADLLAPAWYHRDEGPVYFYGGAFVDFLIRRHGVARFVELFNRCQVATFESDFEAVYGQRLADLEASFWEDIHTP
jgi:hypothetical protein